MDKKNRFGNKGDNLGDPKREKFNKGFSLSYWKIFDIPLFGRGLGEVLNIIEDWLESGVRGKFIATVNPEFVMKAVKDEEFRNLLKETDLNVVDGIGLAWARQVNGNNFIKKAISGVKIGGEILVGKHRESLVSGSDLMPELCKLASKKSYKVFFLGGFGDRAKRTAEYFKMGLKYDFCAGEPEIKNEEVIKQINEFKPDILFVAYGMKKQEEWISQNRNKADFGVAIGVGRSFDYYSGDLKRASEIWRKMGMEWLYSLIKEPKRIKRQLVLPQFVWKVLTK